MMSEHKYTKYKAYRLVEIGLLSTNCFPGQAAVGVCHSNLGQIGMKSPLTKLWKTEMEIIPSPKSVGVYLHGLLNFCIGNWIKIQYVLHDILCGVH